MYEFSIRGVIYVSVERDLANEFHISNCKSCTQRSPIRTVIYVSVVRNLANVSSRHFTFSLEILFSVSFFFPVSFAFNNNSAVLYFDGEAEFCIEQAANYRFGTGREERKRRG